MTINKNAVLCLDTRKGSVEKNTGKFLLNFEERLHSRFKGKDILVREDLDIPGGTVLKLTKDEFAGVACVILSNLLGTQRKKGYVELFNIDRNYGFYIVVHFSENTFRKYYLTPKKREMPKQEDV